MVLKKLGVELMDEFLATVQFLGDHEGMQVSAAPLAAPHPMPALYSQSPFTLHIA